MRLRLLAVLAASLALVAPARAANPQAAGLQVALRAQGLYNGAIDAIVGPATVAAVRSFQRQQGLSVTGRADARTRRALGPFGSPLFGTRTIRRGDFGWDVAVLQYLLIRQHLSLPVNGYFDQPTERALRRYQSLMQLKSDGTAGPATFAALGLQTRVPVPAQTSTKTAAATPVRTYVVRVGDTLTSIAAGHHTTVAVLARLNHLDPTRYLLIGTRLRLPEIVRVERTAAVAATDTLVVRASIDRWAAHYGVDPHLARALAWMESGFQQNVRSPAGAEGIMQVLPSTWQYAEDVLIGHPVPHTSDGNVRVGVAYLGHLLHAFGGAARLALGGWYQGERAVRQHGLYPETKAFVADVLALRSRM